MEPLRDFLEQQLLRKEIHPIVFLLRIFPDRLQPLEPLKDEALAPDREPVHVEQPNEPPAPVVIIQRTVRSGHIDVKVDTSPKHHPSLVQVKPLRDGMPFFFFSSSCPCPTSLSKPANAISLNKGIFPLS